MNRNSFIKKVFYFFVALLVPFFISAKGDKDDLKDISRPYLGTYDAETVKFNGVEYIDDFLLLRVELKKDDFTLYSKIKGGKKRMDTAEYSIEKINDEKIILFKNNKLLKNGKWIINNGKVQVVFMIGDKLLYISFTR